MARPIVNNMCSTMLGLFKQESKQCSSGTAFSLLPSFVEDSKELQIFGTELGNMSAWIGHVNSCLNSAKTRLEGVSLLRALVPQCPMEVFQQHCVPWVKLLTQSLQSFDSPLIISLVSSTLRNLLKDAAQVSELSREVSNSCISVIVIAALDMKLLDSAIDVVSACIQYFPGPCGPLRTRIENFLLQLMSSNDFSDIPLAACRCLALLPRVGGGGQGGIKHVEAWTYYCNRVLTSLRNVVDNLYGETESGSQNKSSHTPLGLPDAPSKEPARTHTLIRHLKMLSACLHQMLRAEFPEVVKVPVNPILSVCCRILALNGKMLSKKPSLKWTLLASSLSTVHIEGFNILSALISSCRGNLILHGHMINKLFIQALGWTMISQSDESIQRPYSGLRVAAYTTLEMWLESLGASSVIQTEAEKLLEQILYDACPQTQTTKLNVTADDKTVPTLISMKLSGKAKQKRQTTPAESTNGLVGHQRVNPLANSQVCLASLKVLRCLLMSVGTRIKPDLHKDVHEFVIPLLLRIQQGSLLLSPAPYSSVDCRKALYHVLLSCVMVPHPRWPAPIHCATSLFSRGRQDQSVMVASFCSEASIICQSIIHPRVPSLQQPLTIAQLDPKKSSTYTTFDRQVRSDLDHMDTNDVSDDSVLPRTVEDAVIVSSFGDWRAPPSDKDESQPKVSTVTDDQDKDKQDEESSDDDDDDDDDEEEIAKDNQGIKDESQIKESIQDNPQKVTNQELSSPLQVEVLTDGQDTDHPVSSLDDEKMPSPRRRSKRQRSQRYEQKREDNNVDGKDDVSKKMKKHKSPDDDKVEGAKVTDETAAMLASFVDSMPDKD